jgi:hypothetical protein
MKFFANPPDKKIIDNTIILKKYIFKHIKIIQEIKITNKFLKGKVIIKAKK